MRVEELQYELPDGLIAKYPTTEREQARMLVVGSDGIEHGHVYEMAGRLPAGALLVVNDSRVIPARLIGRKVGTGGRVELLLVRRVASTEADGSAARAERWVAMARPSRRLSAGVRIEVGSALCAEIEGRGPEPATWQVRLRARASADVASAIESEGHVPLPPYIGREEEPLDRERYQTVYAREPGAVAAPTAGLHLSTELLTRLRERGVLMARVTLHVGPGTFRPVSVPELDDHPMHAEHVTVAGDTVEAIARARRDGSPVVAVGTTVVRALESAADPDREGLVREMNADTRLLIQPGYRFRVVDRLLTNFHLPGSTLLALVYAFAGAERVREAYRAAIAHRYRFYSYGDAMYLASRAEP